MKKLIIPPVFVLISLISEITLYIFLPKLNLITFPYNLSGIVITFLGFIIMGKSRDLFKKHETTLDIKESSSLIKEGIFLKTRNPMYCGMFLLLLGISICFRNLLSIMVPFLFLLSIQMIFIPKEEKMLLEKFGEDYLDYKKKVKRWI